MTSATQPFPKDAFLSLAQTSLNMTEGADLWGFTDDDKNYCRDEMLRNVSLYGQVCGGFHNDRWSHLLALSIITLKDFSEILPEKLHNLGRNTKETYPDMCIKVSEHSIE